MCELVHLHTCTCACLSVLQSVSVCQLLRAHTCMQACLHKHVSCSVPKPPRPPNLQLHLLHPTCPVCAPAAGCPPPCSPHCCFLHGLPPHHCRSPCRCCTHHLGDRKPLIGSGDDIIIDWEWGLALFVCMCAFLAAYHPSSMQSVSQGYIFDDFICCHTEREDADQPC